MEDVIEVTTENELNSIIDINSHQFNSQDRQRLLRDFSGGYFRAFIHLANTTTPIQSISISAYVITHYAYSTWQNRILRIAEIWLDSILDENLQLTIIGKLTQKLFAVARETNCKRINFDIRNTDSNKWLISCLESLGIKNMTQLEDWKIFQMCQNEMKEFVEDKPRLNTNEFKILKVDDMRLYAAQIHNLLRELSIFEKMENQFECSLEALIDDYDAQKCPSKLRFYESMVIVDNENKLVGVAIYFLTYSLKSGIGCIMEDIYIKERYRGKGLGTLLWKMVTEDCIDLRANLMMWPVLGWNKPAINFYFKFKSIDLTDLEKLNMFRFVTQTIYKKC